MNTEANVKKGRMPVCVKAMLIIFAVLIVLGIVGGMLCWLL